MERLCAHIAYAMPEYAAAVLQNTHPHEVESKGLLRHPRDVNF